MLESMILVLTLYRLLSFFTQPYAGYFTDTLSVVISVLTAIRFF
jgi:hypothetical protein